jgi:GNAT superfamily N-acetyltransferase
VSFLTPDDVGARVTVRRRLDRGLSDAVGDLESYDGGVLAIRTRDGSLVEVPEATVVVARVVGPSPLAATQLQAVSGRGWPAQQEEWLGRWWLRAAGGFSGRANSVRPLGDPGTDLDDALTRVADWYAARSLPPAIQVVVGSSLDRQLTERGWVAGPPVAVMTTTLRRALSRLADAGTVADGVRLEDSPSREWLSLFRGGEAPPAARDVLLGSPVVAFASVSDASVPGQQAPIAIGRAAAEPPWVGLSAIEVAKPARRNGHARALIAALLHWAHEHGAARVYLEVLEANGPARALYESLGFTVHHSYLTRSTR